MSKILISINPEYVDLIFRKIKKYEYRTKVAKKDIDSLIIYCTFPTKKVLAEVKIKSILAYTPVELWEKTKDFSGISEEFFMKYFKGRSIAYAYELGEVIQFSQPMDLVDFGCSFAPQSYIYI